MLLSAIRMRSAKYTMPQACSAMARRIDTALRFPVREWVQFKVYLDFDPVKGHAKAWMNGTLVSEALVEGGRGKLEQAHFGLYAPWSLDHGTAFNDDLVIYESVPEQRPEGPPSVTIQR